MSVVDHIIIAVEELEQASADYALMLGRAPSWRGTHPDYGSANTLFRLDNCYLELGFSVIVSARALICGRADLSPTCSGLSQGAIKPHCTSAISRPGTARIMLTGWVGAIL